MHDPMIPATQTGAMKALLRAVSHGFYFFVHGIVAVDTVLQMVARFHERYALDLTVSQRDHARRKGKATFRLFLWPLHGQRTFAWWLLRTDGKHDLLDMEHWVDAREQCIEWPWLYELVRMPVDRALRQKYKRPGGGYGIKPVTWTWRIQRTEVMRLKACVRHFIHLRDGRLAQLLRGLSRAPGFRATRNDVFVLYRYIEKRCQQHRRDDVVLPSAIRTLSTQRVREYPLSVLVRRARAGSECWFPDGVDVERMSTDSALLQKLDSDKSPTLPR